MAVDVVHHLTESGALTSAKESVRPVFSSMREGELFEKEGREA